MNINTKILSQKVKKVTMAFKFNRGGLYIMSRSTMAVKTRHDLYNNNHLTLYYGVVYVIF